MKGRVVDTMEVPNYGMKVEIRLNKKSLTFFAYVGNQLLEAKDAETLKSQIYAAVRDGLSVTWQPIIEISFESNIEKSQAAEFHLEFNRYYVAKVGNMNKWHLLAWVDYKKFENDPVALINRSKTWFEMSGKESLEDKYREYHISISHSRNGERITEDVPHREGRFYRPYSESLWEGLNQLRDAMNEVANRISQLVSTDKGLALLSSGGNLLIEQKEHQDE